MLRGREALADRTPDRARRERKHLVGAEVGDGQIDFRVWAPGHDKVELVIERPEPQVVPMSSEQGGYFSVVVRDPGRPTLYRFRLDDDETLFPDPASRFQPEGPHGPSEVIDPGPFAWTDQSWRGPHLEGQIIYEMHIGTFTPEGDWLSAARQLPELAAAGIGLIEVMPIAEFPGRFWTSGTGSRSCGSSQTTC